jgi:hypothetical protein
MKDGNLKKYNYNYSALGDFDSIKAELLKYIKKFYPDEYANFESKQAGGIILDAFSYIGEMLSFTQGQYFNQLFIETVTDYQSAYNLAQFFGFNNIGPSLPWVTIDATIEVTDLSNLPKIQPGAQIFTGNGSIRYFLTSEIDFNKVPEAHYTKYYKNGSIYKYKIPAQGFATTYQLKTHTYAVTPTDGATFEKFYEISLPDSNVQEIFSVEDNHGQKYSEVSHLIQDTALTYKVNENDVNNNVPYLLFEEKVPYRYIKKNYIGSNDSVQTKIVFGSISPSEYQSKLFNINPADLVLPADLVGIDGQANAITKLHNRDFDPENMILMDQMGIGPSQNDIITVKYAIGGGNNVDTVNPNELKRMSNIDWTWLDGRSEVANVMNSLVITNKQPSAGGKDKLTIEEIKHYTKGQALSQKRAVTPNDYQAIVMSMPTYLGRPEKVHITRSDNATADPFKFYLFLASVDADGYLYNSALNPAFVHNIRMYLKKYKGLSDLLVIKGGNIINFKLEFDVKVDYGTDLKVASFNILQASKSYLDITKWDFGQWFDTNDFYKYIRESVDNISTIKGLKLVFPNQTELDAGNYSQCGLNKINYNGELQRYEIPQDSILEMKHPGSDIIIHAEALKY